MIFYTSQKKIKKPLLQIDGIEINRVTNFNYLGLMINENLNWKIHIEKVANSILNRLKHFLPLNIKTILNTIHVYSPILITASCLVWDMNFTELKNLRKKQSE